MSIFSPGFPLLLVLSDVAYTCCQSGPLNVDSASILCSVLVNLSQ